MSYDDNSEFDNDRKKARGRPFVAGQSGNPVGRPKVEGIKDIRKIAREYTDLAIETLVEICGNSEEKGPARVAAAGQILDRGWGKAPQTVVIDGEVNVAGLNDTSLDEATRREVARFLGVALAGANEAEDSPVIN